MNIFKKKEIKKEVVNLTVDDLVLMTMLNFPEGALGESSIHEFLYNITSTDEFRVYNGILDFEQCGETYYSPYVHRSIESNTKYLGRQIIHSESTTTSAMLSDDLRFDYYDTVRKREIEFAKHIPGYSPRIYYLSAIGHSVAILVLTQKLTEEQRTIVDKLSELIHI